MAVYRFVLYCLFGLLLNGCQSDQNSGPWLPVLEPTSYSSLESSVSKALKVIHQVEEDLENSKQEDASKKLLEAQSALFESKVGFNSPQLAARFLLRV
ncbi:hypothetical protein [Desulfuromonas sp. DDH964]|uniref:hypothetical protein n=1 Tax=Desulfuromonas sp. DDH964 TaxID=1823759 RepID=UPI0008346FC8|nr:hypothetical protein [Desulfuromonas sp. DDH964]